MTRSAFEITPEAGEWIAGRRIEPGQKTILLTEAEALHELRDGSIRRPAAKPAEPVTAAPAAADIDVPASAASADPEAGDGEPVKRASKPLVKRV